MVESAAEPGLKLYAAHINYKLRGEESDAEEQFCRDLCQEIGVKLFVKRYSLNKEAPGNLQQQARKVRYGFFEQLCDKHAIDLIATGHNADDNAETILLHLVRGAGTFGLNGIAERRGNIIRPLLRFSRKQILDYLDSSGYTYCTDSSNLTQAYRRNQIRQQLLPEIEAIFGPQSLENIGRTGRLLGEQAGFLRSEADKCYARVVTTSPGGKIVIAWRRLVRYHTLLRRLALALAFERLTGSLRGFELAAAERLLTLAETGPGRADFIAGLVGELIDDRLYIYRPRRLRLSRKLAVPGEVEIEKLSCKVEATLLKRSEIGSRELRRGGAVAYLDSAAITGSLRVRTAKIGDRFRPLGLKGSKKVAALLADRRVDRPLRDEVLIVEDAERIIWVAGHQISENAKVTAKTRSILRLEQSELPG